MFLTCAQSCFSCQRNSSETAQHNFVKLCSYEGHNVQMRISTGNFDSIFFLGVMLFLNLEIWPKLKILLKTVRQRNFTETFFKLCSYEGHNA